MNGYSLKKNRNLMKTELKIVYSLYKSLVSANTRNGIPVDLRPSNIVGTVQDDPFDCWVEELLKKNLPPTFEVFHSGKLTTPDLVIRDKESGDVIGLEIKKLIQKIDGKDSRGLTLDYNSCLPCGHSMVKIGRDTCIVPCYYLFALLDPTSQFIVTLIILDGDFLNYDFELHREAKYSNFTEYNHGPYGEGSVRHRKMYTYPNPLNSNLECFYLKQVIVLKNSLLTGTPLKLRVHDEIVRKDKFGNKFYYSLVDTSRGIRNKNVTLNILQDIFESCKKREPKERVAYIPEIPAL